VIAGEQVIGERGAEVVHNDQDGDPKANFSFFGSICADGTKLPLILIARGKTARSHRQFGHQVPDPHAIWHSPRGWSTESLMLDSLDWLRARVPDGPICLILDQYGTHVTEAVQNKASELGTSLLWVPKGATGIYQPLDRRVFGALKSKGRAKWRRSNLEQSNRCDRETAAALLIASWEELSDSVVSAAWDFDEPSAELDSDDSSDDDEFDLTLDSNSDGLDAESSDCAAEEDLETSKQAPLTSPIARSVSFQICFDVHFPVVHLPTAPHHRLEHGASCKGNDPSFSRQWAGNGSGAIGAKCEILAKDSRPSHENIG
jgi:hypothetical protein